MVKYLFILIFPVIVSLYSCTSSDVAKTTKVNIEIGRNSVGIPQNGTNTSHAGSKKAYSGYQRKTAVGQNLADLNTKNPNK
ncbi:MAG: hypothetical protein SFY32_12810 [Bacteroidota bacterium]|nr:hypothetical protein [Bacteroidota bacterium]